MKSIAYLVFSTRGRINRKQWWFGVSICAFPLLYIWETYKMHLEAWKQGNMLWIPVILLLLCFLWMFLAMGLKRHHDRNRPELWTISIFVLSTGFWYVGITLIPGVNGIVALLWIYFFGILPGNPDANIYGHPPKPLFKKEESGLSHDRPVIHNTHIHKTFR